MAAKGSNSHYIDNEKFLKELILHRKAIAKAKKAKLKPPGVNNYIGQCFLDIANNLAKRPNFANYTYREEMICDSVENCVMYAANFDPKKSRNPFAFFTQIIYYAFLRRIQREKKQLQTKYRYIDQLDLNELITQEQDNGEFNNQFLDYLKTQLDGYDYEKVVSPATKAAMKKKENEESVLDPNNEI